MALEPARRLRSGQAQGRRRAGSAPPPGTNGRDRLSARNGRRQARRRQAMANSDLSGNDAPDIVLEIDPATVCFLIAKARALDAKAAAGAEEVAGTAEDDLEEALEKYAATPAAPALREVTNAPNANETKPLVA